MSKRIIIVGGGVIGLCVAYYAQRRGHHVTVLERGGRGHDSCSLGNAGLIVPSHFVPLAAPGMVAQGLKWMWNPESPFYVKPQFDRDLMSWAVKFWRASTPARVRAAAPLIRDLSFASRACYEELAGQPGFDFGWEKRGLLMLCRTEQKLDDEARLAQQARVLGIPAEVLDTKAAAALEPGVRMDIVGAVHFPRDCHLAPERLMECLQRAVESGGGAVRCDAEVTGWRIESRKIVAAQTMHGEIGGDEFVLCGGAWTPGMARELRLALPMQAGKGYALTLPQPRQLPRIPAIFTEARVAVTPLGGALRFAGTMEIAGFDERINPRRIVGIIKSVPQYYPEFSPGDFVNLRPWSGLRPCSPDGLPYIGRPRRFANLCLATGHAMMGLSLGAITGELVAAILSGEKPAHDLTLLDPDRYT